MKDWKNQGVLLIGCIALGMFIAFGLRARFRSTPPKTATVHEAPEAEPRKTEPAPAGTGLLIDLGNELCPINEAAVDGETSVEWNHIRVNFCCPGCDTKFLRDPENALRKAGIEFTDLRDAIARYENAPPEHKQHVLASIRERWTVVREP